MNARRSAASLRRIAIGVIATALLAGTLAAAGSASRPVPAPGEASFPGERASEQSPAPFRPTELLVRFDPGSSPAARARVRATHALARVRSLPLAGLELVRITDGGTPPERARAVATDPAVRYAEPNFRWRPATVPSDPEFSRLWGLHNTGQTGGTADADIDAPEAWGVTTGSEDAVVAVIDTGLDIGHEDLAPVIWTNDDEIAANGVDDDGNGYVDDVHGWDFYNGDATVFDELQGDDHGTHVAGTIAAVRDNGVGVAGVNRATILPLKFLGPDGGSTSDAILALDYAVEEGARISNNSWGGGGRSQALLDAINAAGARGHLFVAAAGNDGRTNDSRPDYPSGYPSDNIVAVAATDHDDGLASFSNFGATSVDVGAPGVSVSSTVPAFAKAVLVDTAATGGYRAAFHTFGIEGIADSAKRDALVRAALTWTAVAKADPILLVDDDGGASFQTVWQSVLAGLGYTNVTTFTVPTTGPTLGKSGPSAATMGGYSAVIWFTGNASSLTLSSTDQSQLTDYLSNRGGDLLLFGLDIGYDLTADGTLANTFLRDVLETEYVADFDSNLRPQGVTGTPYASVPMLQLKSGTSGDGQSYSSALAPRSGAVAGMRGQRYTWFSGTSMATPHVSAVAALAWAKSPAATLAVVKDALLGGGDAVSSLAGKVLSGRRLNAAGTLARVPVFADVPTSHPFYAEIEELFARGITTGCGTNAAGQPLYCPLEDVRRQAMAAFIVRAKGLTPLTPATPTFADVPVTHPFYGHVERFYEQGVTTGCGTNTSGQLLFCPTQNVKRQAMAAFIVRAKGLTPLTPATPTFADVPATHPFYGHIERFYAEGITTGCGRNEGGQLLFCPEATVKRQAMAAFLVRAFPRT